MRMRRGIIVIGGPARDFTGLQMKGGTIVLLQRRRDSHRRLDEPRHDHFAEAAATDAHVRRGRSLQPDVSAGCTPATCVLLGISLPFEEQAGG